ncbi:MAG: hypothetical protein K8H86_11735 [Ignavibacteriaceae bacterium]|nr:hypothetical protein [Ignavibacteriaceae bacterium]
MLGIIDIPVISILTYTVIFYGLSIVYASFSKNKSSLFVGAVIFLTGVVLFIIINFEFIDAGEVILPSSFLIMGLSFLVLYFSKRNDTVFLILGGLLSAVGITIVMFTGHINLQTYFTTVVQITKSYWQIIIIFIVIILLERADKK